MNEINPGEIEIIGKWVEVEGAVVPDKTCHRIESLTKNYLLELGSDPSGWDILYRDPCDGRLWELIYPQSELQGGGPPQLRHLPTGIAKQKYGTIAP